MKNKSAFTLIELLLSVTIVAMLATITLISWRNHINKARDAQRKSDLERISTAFEEYFSDNECYPDADILQSCGGDELSPYLERVPCDPVFKTPYCYIPDSDSETCFMNYRILAPLGNEADPIIEKLLCNGEENCGYEAECIDYTGKDDGGYNYGVSSFNVPITNPTMPTPEPSPSPSGPLPSYTPGSWACWSGPEGAVCNNTETELLPRCEPYVFSDRNICQQYCDASPQYWCED